MASKREFWGLDFETSGTTHEHHVPIQIGIASPRGRVYSSLIGGWQWGDTDWDTGRPYGHQWDERAYEVHGIERERLEDAPKPNLVAAEAISFIEQHSEAWHGERKLVGWNVASFDMPFLRKHLNGVGRVLSYQSADLNAVCFAISEAHGTSYKALKRASKEYAAEQLRDEWPEELWHDAGYDAAAALHSWHYLTSRIKEGY